MTKNCFLTAVRKRGPIGLSQRFSRNILAHVEHVSNHAIATSSYDHCYSLLNVAPYCPRNMVTPIRCCHAGDVKTHYLLGRLIAPASKISLQTGVTLLQILLAFQHAQDMHSSFARPWQQGRTLLLDCRPHDESTALLLQQGRESLQEELGQA
jgi:hypothetical protein